MIQLHGKGFMLILAFTWVLNGLYGQDYKTSIGIKFNPGYGILISEPEIKEPRNTFSGGIEINHRIIKDHVYLNTGVFVYDKGFKTATDFYNLYGDFIFSYNSYYYQYYIGVPLNLVYKRKYLYFGYGASLNYSLNKRFDTYDESIDYEQFTGDRKFLIEGQMLAGIEFNLFKKLLIDFEANLSIGSVNPFFNCGAGVGLKYKLQ